MKSVSIAHASDNLCHLIDQVSGESGAVTITSPRGNAVLIGEDDWRAIQETLFLTSQPGMVDSIEQARSEGLAASSSELGEQLYQ